MLTSFRTPEGVWHAIVGDGATRALCGLPGPTRPRRGRRRSPTCAACAETARTAFPDLIPGFWGLGAAPATVADEIDDRPSTVPELAPPTSDVCECGHLDLTHGAEDDVGVAVPEVVREAIEPLRGACRMFGCGCLRFTPDDLEEAA